MHPSRALLLVDFAACVRHCACSLFGCQPQGLLLAHLLFAAGPSGGSLIDKHSLSAAARCSAKQRYSYKLSPCDTTCKPPSPLATDAPRAAIGSIGSLATVITAGSASREEQQIHLPLSSTYHESFWRLCSGHPNAISVGQCITRKVSSQVLWLITVALAHISAALRRLSLFSLFGLLSAPS